MILWNPGIEGFRRKLQLCLDSDPGYFNQFEANVRRKISSRSLVGLTIKIFNLIFCGPSKLALFNWPSFKALQQVL